MSLIVNEDRCVRIWYFAAAGNLCALTADEFGCNLPEELGPWKFIKTIDLADIDDDEIEAARLIDLHGFCCFEA
jgi:hypothetical protein